eukprot:CAMPEP_0172490574 /NCGR_PEP_ID=MMETSP1066-20121228/21058_1 /TAXON_ID=671091 /ORGANISM="Coscinodiscus wailesii, Strain CCMP2513" /LENGTH=39 /DNA_ID= /DNA_START= /DNA_END= /DNA_ORIENTATION=
MQIFEYQAAKLKALFPNDAQKYTDTTKLFSITDIATDMT